MYLTTACPGTGPFAPQAAARIPAPLRRRATAIALLLLLAAAAAPRQAGAVNSLLPPEGPSAAPRSPDATKGDATSTSKARKSAARRKTSIDKATVVTPAVADKTVPPLAAPVQVPAAGNERWDIVVADRTLNAAMARWAAAAGWQLLWELPVDYAVQAQTSVPGKFEDAVTVVVNSMEGAEIPMKAIFYSGNKVLRIMAKGAQ